MVFVSLHIDRNMHDAILAGKINSGNMRHMSMFNDNFPVEMAPFMFLSLCGDTKGIFYVISSILFLC